MFAATTGALYARRCQITRQTNTRIPVRDGNSKKRSDFRSRLLGGIGLGATSQEAQLGSAVNTQRLGIGTNGLKRLILRTMQCVHDDRRHCRYYLQGLSFEQANSTHARSLPEMAGTCERPHAISFSILQLERRRPMNRAGARAETGVNNA